MTSEEFLDLFQKYYDCDITTKKLIKMLHSFQKEENSENQKLLDELIAKLAEKGKNKETDFSCEYTWNIIESDDYFKKRLGKISDKEILNYIDRSFGDAFPPLMRQEFLNNLIKSAIADDRRETLWRIALVFDDIDELPKVNLDLISDYFIKVKDAYYLAELISVVGEYLDVNSILNKLNDKKLITDFLEYRVMLSEYITKGMVDYLLKKVKDLSE